MEEIKAKFTLNEPEPIKATFRIYFAPSKLSELENDMGFVTPNEIPEVDLSGLATKRELEQGLDTIPQLQLITQANYDALTTKEANTLYLIEE